MIFAARPDVLNHNLETVARLQRAARPSAALRPLARAPRPRRRMPGLLTKSGIILGMGETADEVRGAIADLRNVGVDVLTLGQYLRPSRQHLPVARWWTPDEFAELGAYAEGLGFAPRRGGAARALQLPRQAGRRRARSPRRRDVRRAVDAAPMYRGAAARARSTRTARMRELGVDVLLLSTGADLPYLTGYEAMPLERLTMLVLPADGDAVLVVPRLEAPRVVEQPDAFELVPWDETDDPDRGRRRTRRRRRPATRRRSATTPGPGSCSTCSARSPASRSGARPTSPGRCAW